MLVQSPHEPEIGFAASETSVSCLEESSSSSSTVEVKKCKISKQKKKQRKSSNNLLFPTTSSMPAYYQYLLLQSLQMDDEDVEIVLPKDPRRWSKDDINLWLMELSLEHNINPPLDSNKFPFNGKALCTLKMEMYVSRVPEFGKMLFKDVQLKLAKALLSEKIDKK